MTYNNIYLFYYATFQITNIADTFEHYHELYGCKFNCNCQGEAYLTIKCNQSRHAILSSLIGSFHSLALNELFYHCGLMKVGKLGGMHATYD